MSGKGYGRRTWETVAPIFARAQIKTKVNSIVIALYYSVSLHRLIEKFTILTSLIHVTLFLLLL